MGYSFSLKNYGTKIWGWGSNCDLAPPIFNTLRGPCEWDFTNISAFSTLSIEIKKSGGTSSTAMGDHESGGRVLPTATNLSLNKLAKADPE